jgi:hypothetical protein
MQVQIDETIARKVLSIVDQGLSSGLGVQEPGKMCVEAAVCYALGLPHGDDPGCVAPSLRALKIRLNDSSWSSKQARAKGLRRLAVAQLGSKYNLNEKEFRRRLVDHALHVSTPQALRSAASVQKNAEHKQALIDAANRCEVEGTREAALHGKKTAYAAYAAYAASAYAASAASAASDAAAYAAAYASAASADAAAYAASAASASAASADAAAYAASAAYADARDKSLAGYAEAVVQILIDMKAPGCQWLALTELEAA